MLQHRESNLKAAVNITSTCSLTHGFSVSARLTFWTRSLSGVRVRGVGCGLWGAGCGVRGVSPGPRRLFRAPLVCLPDPLHSQNCLRTLLRPLGEQYCLWWRSRVLITTLKYFCIIVMIATHGEVYRKLPECYARVEVTNQHPAGAGGRSRAEAERTRERKTVGRVKRISRGHRVLLMHLCKSIWVRVCVTWEEGCLKTNILLSKDDQQEWNMVKYSGCKTIVWNKIKWESNKSI